MPLPNAGLPLLCNNSRMKTACPHLQPRQTGLAWCNSFAALGSDFYSELAPQNLSAPYWVGRSHAVAVLLGLNATQFASDELLPAFSGNQPLHGSQPLASVYSGHQFGQWAGQLGDGRALLLGEANGLEIQLKGAGLTPYSRRGDGRAVLRSSIREFLCSEAMHALGVPTTRALCVTGSNDEVWRETCETAAVVTRVAPSFIRFGHFEHFSARNQIEQLKTLADYVIDRFYPACRGTDKFAGNAYAALLEAVSERTAVMVAHWQAVGFCHGVMNTDNMSILGLTIDYGPFQFLDVYDPLHICNHSDTQGRYAFARQPNVAYWNLHCLGQALLPLIGEPQLALAALESFKTVMPQTLHRLMCAKLGLPAALVAQPLIDDLLALLAQNRVDYNIFWRRLSHAQRDNSTQAVRNLFIKRADFDAWMLRYSELFAHTNRASAANLMLKNNPKFVLRNYLCQEAIEAANKQDFAPLEQLLEVVTQPFAEHPAHAAWADFVPDWAGQIEISCSS